MEVLSLEKEPVELPAEQPVVPLKEVSSELEVTMEPPEPEPPQGVRWPMKLPMA